MRLSVACNFDEGLLEGLQGYPVYEIYGKVTRDVVGGGRSSFYLPPVNRKTVERFVRLAHRQGIEFNYLLNASCMGNTEYTRQGQRAIRETLDWVCRIGCDSVTIGNLYLLEIIKTCYPTLKVRVSSHCFTDSVRKAKFWEARGADCIVLMETQIVREFATLRAIRAAVTCDLQLIVNNGCRQYCATATMHASSLSHGSQRQPGQREPFAFDYNLMSCLEHRLREPVNYVRATWIRPEDLHHYEAIGFENFKIVERNTPTPELLRRVGAYATRRYDGNLFDLVLPFNYPRTSYTHAGAKYLHSVRHGLRYFFKPGQVNLVKLLTLRRLTRRMAALSPRVGPSPVYLDNRKLDGFLDRFLTASCLNLDCEQCRYCHRFAAQALRIDPEYRRDVLAQYEEFLRDVHDGSFWEPIRFRDVTRLRSLWREGATRVGWRIASRTPSSATCPLQDEL